jgi:hypothetical protein
VTQRFFLSAPVATAGRVIPGKDGSPTQIISHIPGPGDQGNYYSRSEARILVRQAFRCNSIHRRGVKETSLPARVSNTNSSTSFLRKRIRGAKPN